MLLTWALALVAFVAMGITAITNNVRAAAMRLLPPSPTNATAANAAPDPAVELSLFIKEQKAKIDKFMGELKED